MTPYLCIRFNENQVVKVCNPPTAIIVLFMTVVKGDSQYSNPEMQSVYLNADDAKCSRQALRGHSHKNDNCKAKYISIHTKS